MRSALLCVCFALIVHRGGRATTDEDFKPTPIPLNEWNGEKAASQEDLAKEAPSANAASPAHYWEDALRHSVYLTLVRDKIDQLLFRGGDNKPEHASNEIDDHNLWEKIKSAPFERLNTDEPDISGDITYMAKGRLLEGNGQFRFTEDEILRERCDEKCMQGVRALWSVKRVRQKDGETASAKYHYELTFSVNSQMPKKLKKPFDNSVRTFTVRDGTPVEQPSPSPISYVPRPQRAVWLHKNIVPTRNYHSHNNNQGQGLDRLFLSLFGSDEEDEPPRYKPHSYIPPGYAGPHHSKLGNMGSATEQNQLKKTPFYKPVVYKYSRPPLGPPPTISQAEHHYTTSDKLKIPFAPPQVQFHFPDSDGKLKLPLSPPQIQQPQQLLDSNKINNIYPQAPVQQYPEPEKDVTPIPFTEEVQRYLDDVKSKYPYTPPAVQYHYDVKTKVQPPEEHHHYIESESVKTAPYTAQLDSKYQPSNVVKTTKPAVLPTPPIAPLNLTTEVTKMFNESEITTKEPEIITGSFKPFPKHPAHKSPPTKISYFQDHVRPPVFNAPPGVFFTIDKKPFKPLPPLKYHHNYHQHSKHVKTRPVDFRPSPQVVDIQQFSDPDPQSDAFRPMNLNYRDNATDSSDDKAGSEKHKNAHHKNIHKSKPMTKHELIKLHLTTMSTPDIITAQSLPVEESDSMNWASSLLGAFVKTTPMVAETANNITEPTSSTIEPTTTIPELTTTVTIPTTTAVKQEITTTTIRPSKRTRPALAITKPEKVKKHIRVTKTTNTTTTTTSTEKPRKKRPLTDLTPQASSAATGTPNPSEKPKPKIHKEAATTSQASVVPDATTPHPTTTSTKPTTTTTRLTTTTKQPTTTRTTTTPVAETEEPTTALKNKNRFRQSTLMYKGTSVKHDKWSTPASENNTMKLNTKLVSNNYLRRKGSNFHGYVSSTPKNLDGEHRELEHKDVAYNTIESSTKEVLLEVIPVTSAPTQSIDVGIESEYPTGTEETEVERDDSSEITSSEQGDGESKDHNEFIFTDQSDSVENSNEVSESQEFKDSYNTTTVATTTTSKKSKCKKKKHSKVTTAEEIPHVPVEVLQMSTTEAATTEADIFSQIFGSYTVEGLPPANKTTDFVAAGSENNENFARIDDDLEDFLDSLESKKNDTETIYEYEDDDSESDYSPFNTEDESRSQRHADVSYEDYRDRPYSFLELMAME